jgi:hypothetical protein
MLAFPGSQEEASPRRSGIPFKKQRTLQKRPTSQEAVSLFRSGRSLKERYALRGEARPSKRGTPFREIKDILLYISDKRTAVKGISVKNSLCI